MPLEDDDEVSANVRFVMAAKDDGDPYSTPVTLEEWYAKVNATGKIRGIEEFVRTATSSPWPPLCNEMQRLLDHKRSYYSCSQDPLENAMRVRDQGIEPWVYQLARIGEKVGRLDGLRASAAEWREIRKTLQDIAGHAIVAIACVDRAVSEAKESRDGTKPA
jgi:hypothetical protein